MRFPMETRVTFRWIDESGVPHEREGRTLNISELGAFVRSREHPPQGTPVQLTVFLPPVQKNHAAPTPMLLHGRVVRIEDNQRGEEAYGFAVEVKPLNPA
jgi:hypothetical protein